MMSKMVLTASASALVLTGLFLAGTDASARPVYRPLRHGVAPIDPNQPLPFIGADVGRYIAPKNSTSGTWADVANLPFKRGPWNARMQTDGTVLISDYLTKPGLWYKLTPDNKGRYEDGTWHKIEPMPSGYSPLFFASQTLPDGRMIVNGGEYNKGGGSWVTLGALYNPVANSWTSVSPPSGWSTIGDAESVILPNGTYMLANCCDSPGQAGLASINGTKVKWTKQNTYNYNDEEAFTPLPNGDLMLVDVWNHGANYDDYEIYNTSAGTWKLAGQTADYLSTSSAYELGPAVVRPDGTILQFSANPSVAVNDIYDIKKGTWSSGPTLTFKGTNYDCADAPAVELPGGNTLVQASPGIFAKPSHFWEIGLANKKGQIKVTQVSDPVNGRHTSSFEGTFLMLPTGQALWDNSQANVIEVATYTPVGSPKAAWLPVVSSVSNTLTVGSKGNPISGTNFNGFSLGASYGDDGQMSTNYPIIRIANNSTGDVCYARSYNFSTMGIWTTGTTSAEFEVPKSCETGASTLQAVVNGIASTGTSVTLK